MTWTQHPSVFISGNTPCLKVFKYLKADPTLPKYLVDGKVVIKNRKPMTVDEYIRGADGMSEYRRSLASSIKPNDKWYVKFLKWLHSKMESKEIPPETFENTKDLLEKNVISTDIINASVKLKELIKTTMENGQVALSKRLENEHKNIINEIVLLKNNLLHYLTEDDVVNLLKKADFGIRIDFWNDYPELIPNDVLEAKKKADALCIFDNWCVMHYDPQGKALTQIQTEEWRRDPILFGMIIGSDRLYYVKDWKTEKDDLTIDKLCKILNIDKIRETRDYSGVVDAESILMSMDEAMFINSSFSVDNTAAPEITETEVPPRGAENESGETGEHQNV